MQNKPLVSIITPCYNSENYISRYLNCILNQTYSNVQLVIINDGSTDKTEDIIKEREQDFAKKGYNLTYVYQQNKGIGGAINTGLKHVKGEYFAWCDSDNLYTQDYIEEKVKYFLENPQYSIVRCDGFIVNEGNITKPITTMAANNTDKYKEDLFDNCIHEYNFHFGCAMLKTSDFDAANPSRDIYESREGQNWQLLLPMFYHYKSGYIDKPMFYFVYREDSVSNRVSFLSVEKQIQQKNEHQKILCETILQMNLPKDKEQEYIRQIKTKYSKTRFFIYVKENHHKGVERERKFLKAQQEWGIKHRVYYLSSKFKTIKLLLKVYRYVVSLLK